MDHDIWYEYSWSWLGTDTKMWTTTYDMGIPGPGLGQAQKCGPRHMIWVFLVLAWDRHKNVDHDIWYGYSWSWFGAGTKMWTTTYDMGIPGPGLGQAQKCGKVKPINGIQPSWYRITANFCGVKFLQFWSKKKTFNFCGINFFC